MAQTLRSIFFRPFDLFFLIYFVVHIPITIFLDSQIVFPREWYPQACKDLLDKFMFEYGDPLTSNPPSWFMSMVYSEIFFQSCFCLLVPIGLVTGAQWTRIATIIYGVHVATTLVPIFGFYLGTEDWDNKWIVMAFNFPYFFVPALMALKMSFGWDPYVKKTRNHGRKKRV